MPSVELTPIEDFAALGQRWQALEADADGGFFRGWAFLGCAAETRFRGALLLSAQADGQDVALGLLGRGQGRLWLNQTGDRVADSVFIEHNGLLVRRGHGQVIGPALREAVRQGGALMLSGIDPATLHALTGDFWLEHVQTRLAPCVDLTAMKRPFLENLSANARGQIRRSMRLYGPDLKISRAATPEEAHACFEEMRTLHQATWRKRGGPGAFAEPSIVDFHKTLIARAWKQRKIDLLRITAGQRPIGLLYNFIQGGRVLSYQSGFAYDQADPRQKPGLVCHALAIDFYASQGVRFYDLLAGPDRYKLTFSTTGAQLHWATLHRPFSPAGILAKAKTFRRHLGARKQDVLF